MTPEGRVKALVRRRLLSLGDCWFFMPVQNGFGAAVLDYIGCYQGVFFAVETKKDAKTPLTPRQLATKAAMEDAGAAVFVVYDAISAENMIMELRNVYS